VKTRAAISLLALALAAFAPLLPRTPMPRLGAAADFPGWPTRFEGVALARMAPGREDGWFARDFPGKVARFSAGDRQVVVRWVNSPTRRLHPASHCFTGAGYALAPEPMTRTQDGALMSCFTARKGREALKVCEQFRDSKGGSYPDVSAWYWHALAAPAGSAWWSFVIVERAAAAPRI
jgi:hypothetical protein